MRFLLAACLLLLACAPTASAAPLDGLPRGAGVSVGWDCCTAADLTPLGARWYTDYHPAWDTDCLNPQHGIASVPGAQRVNMAWSWMPASCLARLAAARPGQTWIIGNEPNDPQGAQDNCGAPAACRAVYATQIAAIRAADPRAVLISPGLAEGSTWWAGQIAGLDFNAWDIHLYTRRADADDVLGRVAEFRAWQAGRGDRRPLILGETGIWPGTPEWVAAPALRSLAAGLRACGCVRAWAWFSVDAGGRWPGNLLTPSGGLTAAGWAFREMGP